MADASTAKHILAINQSEDVLQLFKYLLEDDGYRVTTRPYIDKDLDAIVRLAPDLIILDYMWSEEDLGWSLLQMLRMNPGTAEIPIVLCTGAISKVEELQGHFDTMGIGVVLKPFDIATLLVAIEKALTPQRQTVD
ncbi:MAG: response regulator [Thermomicrobiales bacterium]